MRRRAPLALLLAAGAACSGGGEPAWRDVPLGPGRVTVMTYNVENLFDASHDDGRDDYDYLPLAAKRSSEHARRCAGRRQPAWRDRCLRLDWSEAVVERKLERLAGVILSAGEGRGPDVLVLQEVENAAVLERLRARLGPAAYRPGILIEGGDRRGIDVAVLTRLPAAGEPRLHLPPGGRGRGILEARLRLPDGAPLTLLALHLPSPNSPRGAREDALRRLAALGSSPLTVAAGDFNITAGEDAAYRMLDRLVARDWLISHRIGCAGCRGTTYHRATKSWSFLDMILLSKDLHPAGGAPWVALRDSVRVVSGAPQQKDRGGSPARFDPPFGTGTSDHWPLVLTLAERERSPG